MNDQACVREFTDLCASRLTGEQSYVIAALTDEYIVNFWDPAVQEDLLRKAEKVLEIRVFNRDGEMKLFRSGMGRDFRTRWIDDRGLPGESDHRYDEWQILDIDTTALARCSAPESSGQYVVSTGGGEYFLPWPDPEDAAVRIRYYLGKYEGTGQARIEDWRIVEFGNMGRC